MRIFYILFCYLIIGIASLNAQNAEEGVKLGDISDVDLPVKVKSSFATNFPGATQPDWGQLGENLYFVEFKQGNAELLTMFDATGNVTKKGSDIREDDAPDPIFDFIRELDPSLHPQTIYSITINNLPNYWVFITLHGVKTLLTFDDKGKIADEKLTYLDTEDSDKALANETVAETEKQNETESKSDDADGDVDKAATSEEPANATAQTAPTQSATQPNASTAEEPEEDDIKDDIKDDDDN